MFLLQLNLLFYLPLGSHLHPVNRLDKKVGGDTMGIADLNWPKGCSVPYSIMSCSKNRWYRMKGGEGCLPRWWLLREHDCLCNTGLVFFSLHLLNSLLTHKVFLLLLFLCSVPSRWQEGGRREGMTEQLGGCSAASQDRSTTVGSRSFKVPRRK